MEGASINGIWFIYYCVCCTCMYGLKFMLLHHCLNISVLMSYILDFPLFGFLYCYLLDRIG